jgi:hypothetical protein
MLFYLVRAIAQAVNKDRIGERRYKNLAAELTEALVPIAVANRTAMRFAYTLASRFRVDLAGGDDSYPVELRTPDWHMRWDRAARSIDYRAMRATIEENPAFVAQFAVGYYESVDDLRADHELIVEYDLPDEPPAFVPTLPSDMVKPREYITVWTVLTPLAHGADEKSGNTTMMRREPTYDALTGRHCQTPFKAGNAIRGVWRDLVMGHYLRLLGLESTDIPPSKAHALFAGGSVSAGSDTAAADPVMRATARRLCPPWDLFAGCIEQQIMGGRGRIGDAVLVCRENSWRVADVVSPEDEPADLADRLRLAEQCTALRLGTRQAHKDVPEADGCQMLFNTEYIIPGCQLVHRIALSGLTGISEVTQSCFAALLDEFAAVPFVGAQASHGFGKIAFAPYQARNGAPELPSPCIYLDYVAEHSDEMREWAMRPAVPVSAKKSSRRKSRAADTADAG